MRAFRRGFTVVELIIVVAVIGILAAITIVVYDRLGSQARDSSLKSDLVNAAKTVDMHRTRQGSYPTSLPTSVQPTQGNVLHLAMTDSDGFCINGYGPGGEMMSIDTIGNPKSHLCSGALQGSPVGGSVPAVPPNTNLVSDFSSWQVSGGVTYNASTQQICLGSTSGTARSPLVRVDGSTSVRLTLEAYATQPSPNNTPNSAGYYSSSYFQSDGVTPAVNTTGHTGNGNAQVLPLSSWKTHTWNAATGAAVKYIRFTLNSAPASYTSDNCYRNPQIVAMMP